MTKSYVITDNEKRDTVVEDVDKASNPYQAVEVPDDDEGRQEIVPLVSGKSLILSDYIRQTIVSIINK